MRGSRMVWWGEQGGAKAIDPAFTRDVIKLPSCTFFRSACLARNDHLGLSSSNSTLVYFRSVSSSSLNTPSCFPLFCESSIKVLDVSLKRSAVAGRYLPPGQVISHLDKPAAPVVNSTYQSLGPTPSVGLTSTINIIFVRACFSHLANPSLPLIYCETKLCVLSIQMFTFKCLPLTLQLPSNPGAHYLNGHSGGNKINPLLITNQLGSCTFLLFSFLISLMKIVWWK